MYLIALNDTLALHTVEIIMTKLRQHSEDEWSRILAGNSITYDMGHICMSAEQRAVTANTILVLFLYHQSKSKSIKKRQVDSNEWS